MTPTKHAARTDEELAARLRLGVMRLARRLRQQAEHGATPSMLSALSTIERLGPIALGRLAEVERVQPPTLTKIVGRLEAEGLVKRETDEIDHRVVHVRLTRRGRDLIQRARSRKDAFLAGRLARLSSTERAALEDAMGAIEHMLEEGD
jgi:DNA-binding MarR family transcriptional regulator